MTNHVHLLASPHKIDGISNMMQSVGRCYVRYFNREYRRSGRCEKAVKMSTPHEEYLALGNTDSIRQSVYLSLCCAHVDDKLIKDI